MNIEGHDSRPLREVRASFDDSTVTVYQAYASQIAVPAVRDDRFPALFKRSRMTWIKPSFLWMMYRSGWATKRDQERVVAVRMTRAGFEWALGHAALSHFDGALHANSDEWCTTLARPVRVQWDPERDLYLRPLRHRAIQVGLGGIAVAKYCDEWILGITDVTYLVREVRAAVAAHELDLAARLLPRENPYPLPEEIKVRVGVG